MRTLEEAITGHLEAVRELRHELHRHPELGYEEHGTAQRVLEFIGRHSALDIQTEVAVTGLVLTIGKDLPGPCVGLRADMDALALEETSGVEWSSTVPGKAHACGHDGHTAMLAGAARVLLEQVDQLRGPVKLIFQPAEEGGAGGRAMVEAGALENPRVEAIYGLHSNLPDSRCKVGPVYFTPGPAMAGTGTFDIEIIGQGGHAALPHRAVDPLYIGACIVEQLQGIVSRSVNPMESAVVSVTRFHAGTTHNIIPERAHLHGTFRAIREDLLQELHTAIPQRVKGIAAAHGARAEVRCVRGYPVLRNDERAEEVFRAILKDCGQEGRLQAVAANMGGEDFAYFAREIPGFFYFLPACPADRESYPVCHDPSFDFNDTLLADGMHLHVETGLRFARHWAG